MAWNLDEVATRARDRATVDSSNGQLPTATVYRMVNQAMQQVALEADWPWLRTVETLSTVAGVSTLPLQAGFLRTIDLVLATTGQPIFRRRIRTLDQIISTGRPYMYAVDGNVLTVKAIPDGVYTLQHRFVQSPPTLVLGTDVPLVPEVYGQGVVLFTANLMALKINQNSNAQGIAADYVAWVKRSRGHINQSREPLSVSVRPGGFF